ncbi:AMP-binding protein [Actinophytocola glycyrrhizae]|uniref:AMP-binding protein n=1 Tax=Actinophytocola glycyrrhizae TaxID=2044873 RepID=A0ABV9SAV1_9PSEU
MTSLVRLAADPELARRYRSNGWWRDTTFLDDVAEWARTRPDDPVLVNGRTGDGTVRVVSYREFDRLVRRIAGGLVDFGVRTGDVVAFQLPDWWETAALLLACVRVGAVAQPIVPQLRAREIERALARTGARVCVTVDSWAGYGHARALAEMAPRLPGLRQRVVYGDAEDTGAVDFHDCFVDRPDPDLSSLSPVDPDQPSMVLFTSGSTGEPKGVLHTCNTIYAGASGFMAAAVGGPGMDRAATTMRVSHIACPLWAVFGVLLTGGTGVFQDAADPGRMLDLMAQAGTTRLLTSAPTLAALVAAQRERPRELPSLHTVMAGGTTVPPGLVPTVRDTFGVPLRAVWGMTENVVGTAVRADDPPDWSAHSDGRPLPGLEVRVVTPDVEGTTGALQVRGASMCVGTITDDIERISTTGTGHGDWFDTGDLARADGRGGIRIEGRVADRVYDLNAEVMIPVRDVEEELQQHPGVKDVAIISRVDGAREHVCAVVVPGGEPPTLEELHDHLRAGGMTESYYPDRLELVDELPRDPLGKLRKHQLRATYDAGSPP